eukprot:TRINITY_DN467_c1_g1_i2.p1 TRINITY_DN467_c1_g1~~TRINITY_DN467_c1_g1_i2.p1  ORF type:complete len:531 (-),score=198.28 TRINITY_DN467_c1_g1_i2:847-2241(-)
MINKILKIKADPNISAAVRGLVLVPTRELSQQVAAHIKALLSFCYNAISVLNISDQLSPSLKTKIAAKPDIIVSTPAVVSQFLESNEIEVRNSLECLIIDEADLLLSYGYAEDIKRISAHLPRVCQGMLMSATFTSEVDSLKKLILHNPAILRLEEPKAISKLLSEFYIKVPFRDKFLVLYSLLRLKVLPQLLSSQKQSDGKIIQSPSENKVLIFVNDIERCYMVKLFLERFSIKSAVLNSELPVNTRYHTVQEFNKGIVKFLIATDAKEEIGDESEEESASESENENESGEEMENENTIEKEEEKEEKEKEEEEIRVSKKGVKLADGVVVVPEDDDETKGLNMEALRKYELQTLKYYFAIIECDSVATAKAIYEQCDGLEIEKTANIFDLRFVPDEQTFTREPKERVTEVPTSYKSLSFYTKAVQDSKVTLSWDETPLERKKLLRRDFTKLKEDDIDEKALSV